MSERVQVRCDECKGSGYIEGEPCDRCGCRGWIYRPIHHPECPVCGDIKGHWVDGVTAWATEWLDGPTVGATAWALALGELRELDRIDLAPIPPGDEAVSCFVCNQVITDMDNRYDCHTPGCSGEGCDCDLPCHPECCPECEDIDGHWVIKVSYEERDIHDGVDYERMMRQAMIELAPIRVALCYGELIVLREQVTIIGSCVYWDTKGGN